MGGGRGREEVGNEKVDMTDVSGGMYFHVHVGRTVGGGVKDDEEEGRGREGRRGKSLVCIHICVEISRDV